MSLVPAKFDHLWAELPQHNDFKTLPPKIDPKTGKPTIDPKTKKPMPPLMAHPKIPLEIPAAWEPCCILMSHALNQVGLTVKPKVVDLRDPNGRQYMMRVPDMHVYLDSEYGTATNIPRVADDTQTVIPRWLLMNMMSEEKGIIAFGNRHIDLWDGTNIHGLGYSAPALWEAYSALEIGLFIWTME